MVTKKDSATTFTMPSEREIMMTRVFDAPPALVFKALTDPELIPQWWGPAKYTTKVDKHELKPGGVWRYLQHDKEGNEFAFNGVFQEVVPPERIVSTFEYEGMPGHVVLDTVTFEAQDGKTRVTTRSVFQSQEDRDGMMAAGMEEGASESWDRLAALLSSMAQR